MQESKSIAPKLSIIKSLKSDPDRLFVELSANASNENEKDLLKFQLNTLAPLLSEEANKQEERKGVSRKIGKAKRNNEDCSELISSVAQISKQVDELNLAISDLVSKIELAVFASDETAIKKQADLPLHLVTPTQIDRSDVSNSPKAVSTVSHTDRVDPVEWHNFVEKIPHATAYHDACWKDIISTNFNHNVYQITSRDQSGQLNGILPLCHLDSRIFGSFTISMPYFNYGGPLASSPAIEQALLSHAATLSSELACSHMEIRETRARKNWKVVQRKVSMILPLPSSDADLDAQLGSKLRAQVNKTREHNLRVEFGGTALLEHFYQVFSRNMRDLGTPVYGKKIFEDILNNFPNTSFLAVVYKDDKPLAVGFLLGYRDKLEIPWASSIKSQNHLGANMFMYRSILKEAISRNYQFFDFGRSTVNASTHKFKKQWGAKEHSLHWHYWTQGNADVPEINPDNPKYKLVINIWRKLPIFVTNRVGPLLARNLP